MNCKYSETRKKKVWNLHYGETVLEDLHRSFQPMHVVCSGIGYKLYNWSHIRSEHTPQKILKNQYFSSNFSYYRYNEKSTINRIGRKYSNRSKLNNMFISENRSLEKSKRKLKKNSLRQWKWKNTYVNLLDEARAVQVSLWQQVSTSTSRYETTQQCSWALTKRVTNQS